MNKQEAHDRIATLKQRLAKGVWTGADAKELERLKKFAVTATIDEVTQRITENVIAHYRPEDLSADEPALMEERLKGRSKTTDC
jgi:hypothetical protein